MASSAFEFCPTVKFEGVSVCSGCSPVATSRYGGGLFGNSESMSFLGTHGSLSGRDTGGRLTLQGHIHGPVIGQCIRH